MAPRTRYAKKGDVNIAYQVVGDAPIDLVLVNGLVAHLDLLWTEPSATAFVRRLASFSRLIMFDKPGTGLSDPIAGAPTIEQRMADVLAVGGRRQAMGRGRVRARDRADTPHPRETMRPVDRAAVGVAKYAPGLARVGFRLARRGR